MSALAPTLQAFFTDRLIDQRQVSGHTVDRLSRHLPVAALFSQARSGKAPSELDIADLDFERSSLPGPSSRRRHNGPRTRKPDWQPSTPFPLRGPPPPRAC